MKDIYVFSIKIRQWFLKNIKNISILFFILLSFFIFFKLFNNPQAIAYDSRGYYSLGKKLYESRFNLLSFNFGNRTYVFPLYISLLIAISKFIHVNDVSLIYFFNYLIFLLSIFFVNKVIESKNKSASVLFLILSAFNIINLSFTNTILTESLVVLFVCLLFFLLNSSPNRLNIFLIGFVSSLNVLARPSNLLLFICVFLYISILVRKNLSKMIFFLIPVYLIFCVSMVNVYNTENRIGLFTNKTQDIYEMQVKGGVKYLKYETNVGLKKYANETVYYPNKLSLDLSSENCNKSLNCLVHYFVKNPLNYSLILGMHFFNLFDRVYINTYVKNMDKIDNLLIIYNYFILSSVVCFFVFSLSLKKLKKSKYWNIYTTFFILFFGTILIYIPTIVEPRFSSPVFPLLIMISSFYFVGIYKNRNKKFTKKILISQVLIIITFLIISYLTRQSAVLILN